MSFGGIISVPLPLVPAYVMQVFLGGSWSSGTPLSEACPSSSAQVGVPYASPFVTSGGQPDYNYAITTRPLPPGLNLLGLSKPYIYGTPTTANTYPYTAQVTDSASNKMSSNCSITVTQ